MSNTVGTSIPLIDAREKATGQLIYGADYARPGMLYGKVLRSPIARGRIRHIDTARARALPGVRAVVTGADFECPFYSVAGVAQLDEQLLARDMVHYQGDEVAVVAAVDEETAERALSLIDVEYEELPGVFDLEEAMRPDSPLVHERFGTNIANKMNVVRGDVEEAFVKAAVIVEGSSKTPRVHHGYIEPNAGVAQWYPDDRYVFWISTQSPVLAKMTYSHALGVAEDHVRVIQLPLGGGFGGKLEYKLHPLCALLSKMCGGKPVKMVNSRKDELMASIPRLPMEIHMQLAVAGDGTFLGKKVRLLADNGAYMNYGIGVMLSAVTRNDNLYRIKNISTQGYLIYTNRMPTGAMRGFGCPQSHYAQEILVDRAAAALNMDPVEIRLKNASQTGDITPHEWRLDSCGLSDCIKQSAAAAEWPEKQKTYAEEDKDRDTVKGIGIASCLHVSGNRTFLPFFDGSSAYVRIDEEGKVLIFPGEVDLGQGSKTLFAIIAAQELGIPIEWIRVSNMDTDTCPHGMGTFGDRVTTLGGNAVKAAAIDARRQILDMAAELMGATTDQLTIEDGVIRRKNSPAVLPFAEAAKAASYKKAGATIIGHGSFVPQNVRRVDPETKAGNVTCAVPFVTQIVEVEVNKRTGEVRLLNIVSSHDLGKAINPLMAQGQVYGAVAMGMGFALSEEMMEEHGIVQNQSFKHYDMMRATDMPPIDSLLIESNDPNGPYGGKGLGEPALTGIAPAITNAIYNAAGIWVTDLPITPEKVLKALREADEPKHR